MRKFAFGVFCCFLQIGLFLCPSWACTSFCFNTPAGPVFGSNLDFYFPGDGVVLLNRRGIAKKNIRQGIDGKTAHWVSAYGSVTFSLAGRGFAWSGMNEAGLVMTGMELKASKVPKPDQRPPFDNGSLLQYILDTCGSVAEAIEGFSRVRLVSDGDAPCHFLVADSHGQCAALEYLGGRLVCYTGENLPVNAMSNMPYARTLAAYRRGGPRWWWSNPGHSAERFTAAADRMKRYDASGNQSAAHHALETLTQVVAGPHTRWHIVYDIAKREVWFGSVTHPTVKRLSLNAFDLSCQAPLLMLDVNVGRQGRVERFFKPYDNDLNLKLFSTLCQRLGIEVSKQGAAELMQLFESFKCAR